MPNPIKNRRMQIGKRRICFLFSAATLLIAQAGCEKKHEAKSVAPVAVDVAPVTKEKVAETLSFVGDIKAKDEAILYSKVSGKFIAYQVQEGQKVKKSDAVALIDRDELGYKYEEATVSASIDGTVGRTYLDRGAAVRLDTPVALIVAMDEVRIKIAVMERYFSKIQVGQTANITVDAYPGEVFVGQVTKESPVIDILTRTAPIEISVPNPDYRLTAGMFANVEIAVREDPNALVVPESAVVYGEGKNYVFTIADAVVRRKEVEIGVKTKAKVEIRRGLSTEDIVITAGQSGLQDGSLVTMKKQSSADLQGK